MNANETTGALAPSTCAEAQTIHHNRPALRIYHANAKGTGSALTVALDPATATSDGRFIVALAPQSDGNVPTFDWPREVVVGLRFADVCEFLRVFRGETESIADGRGQFHRTPAANIRVHLRHVVEPVCCYSLEVYERRFSDSEERRVCIVLTSAEATGLCLALEHSMSLLAFGIPEKGAN